MAGYTSVPHRPQHASYAVPGISKGPPSQYNMRSIHGPKEKQARNMFGEVCGQVLCRDCAGADCAGRSQASSLRTPHSILNQGRREA